ncbi:MAG: hypothetical protein JW747_09305 [Candidatus Aminicenantes bacterium]|nr:hypothetical protein [Candidatus Aminicenantes bacterium]
MKRDLSPWPVVLSLTALLLAPLSAQTAKDVLNKMIEAQGGRKVIEAMLDSTSTGTFELVQFGMQGSITMYQKEPNKMRMDMEVQGFLMTQAFDGEVAWGTNPQTGAVEPLSEIMTADFKREYVGNTALLDPEALGIAYELQGTETIGDKDYLVLVQKFSDGHANTLFLDPETHLPYKTKGKSHDQMGSEIETETTMTDYRNIDGIPVAHSLVIYQDGVEFIRISLTSVKFNSGLEDTLFKMTP